MFGKKFTAYRLRKKQTQEVTDALEATLIKAWEPHRKAFFAAIEPTVQRILDTGYFEDVDRYDESPESIKALIGAIYEAGIPKTLNLTRGDVEFTTQRNWYRNILNDALQKSYYSYSIKNGFYVDITDGFQIVIKFDSPENLHKAYIRAVAKTICAELIEIASSKKETLNKKYAPERSSNNKESLERVGKFSTSVSKTVSDMG